jgi:hypothetical protein
MLKNPGKQVPGGLKPARDDKSKGLVGTTKAVAEKIWKAGLLADESPLGMRDLRNLQWRGESCAPSKQPEFEFFSGL